MKLSAQSEAPIEAPLRLVSKYTKKDFQRIIKTVLQFSGLALVDSTFNKL